MKIVIPQPKVRHLINRAAFGHGLQTQPADIKHLFADAEKIIPLNAVNRSDSDLNDMLKGVKARGDSLGKQMVVELFTKSRQNLMKANVAWMDKITQDPTLRERMTFFWHGHFACRSLVAYLAQQQNNTIRTFALASFSELLMAVAKDPAMLQFLNNQQNRKDHPNENFAREVMELFTLGRGNYSEQDVKEAARAFTGWGFNPQTGFVLRQRQHDFGPKTFRGVTKDFTGEQILQAILEDRKTAQFITTKLYRSFVSDQPAPAPVIGEWSDSFYRSGYNIEKLLGLIFQSDEFNKAENMGTRIKSPVELLAVMLLQTGGRFENPQSIIFLQRALGQVLFYPPNVSGWPSGKGWIDSSSLAFRLGLPMLMFGGAETDFATRDDGDANGLAKVADGKKRLQCKTDWQMLANRFTKSSSEETIQTIESYLLSKPTTPANRNYISTLAAQATQDPEFVKRIFIGFMSLPEYQLC